MKFTKPLLFTATSALILASCGSTKVISTPTTIASAAIARTKQGEFPKN